LDFDHKRQNRTSRIHRVPVFYKTTHHAPVLYCPYREYNLDHLIGALGKMVQTHLCRILDNLYGILWNYLGGKLQKAKFPASSLINSSYYVHFRSVDSAFFYRL
jgi:hypothetical protein